MGCNIISILGRLSAGRQKQTSFLVFTSGSRRNIWQRSFELLQSAKRTWKIRVNFFLTEYFWQNNDHWRYFAAAVGREPISLPWMR